jgi:HlyD family secretion protein
MLRRFRWIIIIVAVVLGIWVLRATVFAPKPIAVEIATVEKGIVEETVTNSQAATVRSRLRARVGTRIIGTVDRLPHREGSVVKKGTVLVSLDKTTAQRELALAEANVASAQAEAVLAAKELERARTLRRDNLVSENALEKAIAAADRTTAGEAATEASLKLVRQMISDLNIRAPFNGVVAELMVELGESVIPGQPVIEMLLPDSLYVSTQLDEIDVGRVKNGLPARVRFDPYPDIKLPGQVVRVAPYISDVLEQNRTLEVEVEFRQDGGDPHPRPGTSADVEIILNSREDVIRVPTFAVIGGNHVLVIDGETARRRDIETGLRNWDYTEVISGLDVGEVVITSLDRINLKAGVRVRIRDAAAGDE